MIKTRAAYEARKSNIICIYTENKITDCSSFPYFISRRHYTPFCSFRVKTPRSLKCKEFRNESLDLRLEFTQLLLKDLTWNMKFNHSWSRQYLSETPSVQNFFLLGIYGAYLASLTDQDLLA